MELIFIPKLTKKHLLFLAFSISSFLRELLSLRDFYKDITGEEKKEDIVQKKYFDIIQNVISDLLQGILFLLYKIKLKREAKKLTKKKDNFESNEISFDKEDNIYTNEGIIKVMIKISGIDFLCQLLFLIFALIFKNENIIKRSNQDFLLIIDITTRFLFCRMILNTYFYKHHIASMLVNSIVFLILGFFDIYNIASTEGDKTNSNAIEKIFFAIVLVIQTTAYSYEDVLNKIALTKEYMNPYSLLFYKGLFQVPLVIATSLFILIYKDDNHYNVFQSFFNLEPKFKNFIFIKRSIFIFFNILRSIFLVQVIDNFSSPFLSILKVLESLFIFIYNFFDNQYDKLYEKIIIPFLFVILVLTSLVYNEIVVLNIFGLQDYTQHGLDIQAEKDLRDDITEISEINSEISSIVDSRKESFVTQNISFSD